ncbi:ComEA family DNA-binding protein [Alysiella filiformis]|uniref:ComEA protein n=1 Tax=Alysiella filiformis DSM 16848 TaxID=1120981 RepID=A0A286ERU9_9NEIS|nr:helix-hairpin-helix domain-containing protein [Alysiella filiformis]QMT31733.1 helix-hairpin-helix domain-containing protein [Alysiella filiformis]UBQ55255.1 helix-hairpin-helix domain-containing protein [Alysiella filiformis DSM 16848]SOD73650.1 comEA protein [Alysiella filiformis DSM 16848]
MNLVRIFAILGLVFSLAACGGEQQANQQNNTQQVGLVSNANVSADDSESEEKPVKKVKKETYVPAEPVNLNTATAEELVAALKGTGVGKAKVAKIIEYREQNHGFKSIDELMEVKGIGSKTLEKMRNRVVITNQAAPANSKSKKVAPISQTE